MRRIALAVAFLCLFGGCEAEAPQPAAPPVPPMAPVAPAPAARRAAPAAPPEAALALPEGTVRVTRSGAGFTVLAHRAPPFEALTALGEAAGFRTEVGAGAPEAAPLLLALESASLEDALAAILAGIPYHVHYEFADGDLSPKRPFEGREVVLTRVGVGEMAAAGAAPATAVPPRRPADPGRRGPPPRAEGRRFGSKRAGPDDPERARQREEAAARERERAEKVARQWDDPREDVRLEAVELMEPEGEDLARLEALLQADPSPEVRVAAAETLADGEAFEVMDGLLGALGDPDPGVVAAVVRGLEDVYGDAPSPRIRERVLELRDHRDPGVREAVTEFEEWIEE